MALDKQTEERIEQPVSEEAELDTRLTPRQAVERMRLKVPARGNRKLRYRGITKNDAWLHHRTAALNLRRLLTPGLEHRDGAWAIA